MTQYDITISFKSPEGHTEREIYRALYDHIMQRFDGEEIEIDIDSMEGEQ